MINWLCCRWQSMLHSIDDDNLGVEVRIYFGTFEWNRVPFGMVDSSRTFVKAVDILLRPIREFGEPYVDNIAAQSDSWGNHLKHIRKFLQTMREHN